MKKPSKCDICGRVIRAKKPSTINAAVVGEAIILKGHQICLTNVDQIVVIPNRVRVDPASRAGEEATPTGFLAGGKGRRTRMKKWLQGD